VGASAQRGQTARNPARDGVDQRVGQVAAHVADILGRRGFAQRVRDRRSELSCPLPHFVLGQPELAGDHTPHRGRSFTQRVVPAVLHRQPELVQRRLPVGQSGGHVVHRREGHVGPGEEQGVVLRLCVGPTDQPGVGDGSAVLACAPAREPAGEVGSQSRRPGAAEGRNPLLNVGVTEPGNPSAGG